MFEILALGTLGFWILITLVCLFLIAVIEYERPGWATLSVILTFVLLGVFGKFNVITASLHHPWIALGCIVGYVAVGVVYSFFKWWRFLRGLSQDYLKVRAQFVAKYNLEDDTIPDRLLKTWRTCHYGQGKNRRDWQGYTCDSIPHARDNKARILTWMIYWPWSMVWTLINDPIKKLFKAIYNRLQAWYQWIADRSFADMQDDFRALPPRPGVDYPAPEESTLPQMDVDAPMPAVEPPVEEVRNRRRNKHPT